MEHVRLKLTVAYDGTPYQGWQTQRIGQGVQSIVGTAIRKVFPRASGVHGSSRTDTGVHAVGLAAHVDIPAAEWRMPPRKALLAINAHLPEEVRILSVQRAKPDFHARFDAVAKQYRYHVWNHPAMNPLLRQHAWHVTRPLHILAMRAAAQQIIGRHDFRAFSTNPGYRRGSTVRTLTRCDIRRSGPRLTFIIEGDGFLYRMCRGVVGTLVHVGLGKLSGPGVAKIFASRDRRVAGMTAPAHGLVLWKVFYRRHSQPGTVPPEDVE